MVYIQALNLTHSSNKTAKTTTLHLLMEALGIFSTQPLREEFQPTEACGVHELKNSLKKKKEQRNKNITCSCRVLNPLWPPGREHVHVRMHEISESNRTAES